MNDIKKKFVILSIDDSEDMTFLIKRYLASHEHTVYSAENGTRGINLAKQLQPDLILLDIMMPRMSGYEVCARLQAVETLRNVPVVFLTAKSEKKDKAIALSLGAVDYLTKPFRKSDLLSVVNKHIRRKKEWVEISSIDSDRKGDAPSEFFDLKNQLIKKHEFTSDVKEKLLLTKAQHIYDTCPMLGMTESHLAEEIAMVCGHPYLSAVDPNHLALGVLPASFCKVNNVIAIQERGKKMSFVLSNPFDLSVIELLKRFAGPLVSPTFYIADPSTIQSLLKNIPATKPSEREVKKGSILVVEDDKNQQTLIHRFLSKRGHEVSLAQDGIDAFMQLGQKAYDLILLDLSLPYMTGLNFLYMKDEKKIPTPVVVFTARQEEEYQDLASQLGALDYVRKPLKKDVLVKTVEAALKKSPPAPSLLV